MNKQDAVDVLIKLERKKELSTEGHRVQSLKEDQEKYNKLIGYILGIDTAIGVIRDEAGITAEEYVDLVILRRKDTGA